jgi:hypothetical protein
VPQYLHLSREALRFMVGNSRATSDRTFAMVKATADHCQSLLTEQNMLVPGISLNGVDCV